MSGEEGSSKPLRDQFVCSYRLRSRTAPERYLAGAAAAMREDGLRRFADRFSASRRILSPLP